MKSKTTKGTPTLSSFSRVGDLVKNKEKSVSTSPSGFSAAQILVGDLVKKSTKTKNVSTLLSNSSTAATLVPRVVLHVLVATS